MISIWSCSHDYRSLNHDNFIPCNENGSLDRMERTSLELQSNHAASIDKDVKPAVRTSECKTKLRIRGDRDANSRQSIRVRSDNPSSDHRHATAIQDDIRTGHEDDIKMIECAGDCVSTGNGITNHDTHGWRNERKETHERRQKMQYKHMWLDSHESKWFSCHDVVSEIFHSQCIAWL